jgi:hypothetical protein
MKRGGLFVREETLRDERAVKMLVAAAEAMLDPSTEHRAAAILYTARALMLIAEGDTDDRARSLAETVVLELRQVPS